MTVSVKAQNKPYYRWVSNKETYCRSNQLQFGASGQAAKIIKIDASYSWKKEKCTEQESINQQKVNISKGTHAANGKEYYFDGNMFYEIMNNSCSARGITLAQYFKILGN